MKIPKNGICFKIYFRFIIKVVLLPEVFFYIFHIQFPVFIYNNSNGRPTILKPKPLEDLVLVCKQNIVKGLKLGEGLGKATTQWAISN